MNKKILNNNRGGISVIITTTVVLILLLVVGTNLIASILHITTRNNVRNLIQTEANTVAQTKVINTNIYNFFNKDVAAYTPILKSYSTTYTIYQYENGDIVEKSKVEGSAGVNLNLTPGQIVKITVKQSSVSQLQKLTSLLNGSNKETAIEVSAEGVVK